MGNQATKAVDFSSIGGKPVSDAPIDFSSIGGKPVQEQADPQSLIKQKYGLSPKVDLDHLLTETEDNLHADYGNFSHAYEEYQASKPKPQGFWANAKERGKQILHGLATSEGGVAGAPTLEGLGEISRGQVPVAGPMVANAKERIKAKDYAGAAGGASVDLLSVAAPLLLGKMFPGEGAAAAEGTEAPSTLQRATAGMSKLTPEEATAVPKAGTFQPAAANTPVEVLQHASQMGLELTPGQATAKPLPRLIQAIGERSLFKANELAAGLDANSAAFLKGVRDFADRMDPKVMGASEESAGEALKQSVATAKDVTHENATQGYAKIQHLMDKPVSGQPISNAWNKMKEGLPMGAEEQIVNQVPRSMKAVVEDLLSGKPEGFTPSFQQGIQLRSFFRDLGDTEGLPTKTQAIYKQMAHAVDAAMESTAEQLQSVNEWRAANAGWKDYTGKYGNPQSPLFKILKQSDPATVTRQILNRGSAADIEALQNEKVNLEPLKRQVIEDVAKNNFGIGKDGLGGYSHAFLNTLFGPEATKELYLKADLGRRFRWEVNPSGTSNVMIGESQLLHPEPSKLGLLAGAAKASMPQNPKNFLPDAVRSNPGRGSLPGTLSSFLTLTQPRNQQANQ